MTTSEDASARWNKAAIESWLVAWIAKETRLDPSTVDAREPLVNFGLGSRQALLLVGDLEDWLGTRLEPSLAWEHPTVERLSVFLAARGNQAPDDGQRSL